MRKTSFLFGLIALLWLTACQAEGSAPGAYSGTLVLDGRHVYTEGQTLPGALAVLDGQVVLGEGARVAGPVFLLGGELTIDGQVAGDVAAIGGNLIVGPEAQIAGDLRAGSGDVQLSPQAQVSGQVLTGPASGVELGDLFPERTTREQLVRAVPEALLLAVLAYLGVTLAYRPLERVMRAATGHPIVSAAMGLLVGIVVPAFLIVMAYTLILIPVTLIGILLGILVIGFGYIALGVGTGHLLERLAKRKLRPPVSAFLGTFVFRVVLSLLALIPAAGSLLELLVIIVAIGAVTLTRFGLREFVPESARLAEDGSIR
jgi:hypothetical protein